MIEELNTLISDFVKKTNAARNRPLITLLGPTASGKTALSLRLAETFNAEIISADSRQIYREMNIGTDKIDEQTRAKIPHHLIDLLNPDIRFTLADFKRFAEKAINEILLRKKLPMLVGGTGLYISAITQNYQIPETGENFELRKNLQHIADTDGTHMLYEELRKIDPAAAAKIHPENTRYIIRALEINYFTGKNKGDQKAEPQYEIFKIGIEWPREELYRRIDKRVEEQFQHGLVDEVKTLLAKGYAPNLPAMTSLGYQQVIDYLNGAATLEETKEKIKNATHNYARRQLMWWRREKDIFWIPGESLMA